MSLDDFIITCFCLIEALARSVTRTKLVELSYLSSYPLFEGLR